jgi:protein-L-isoaspartate(D-aspartate) O-methyltransferase
VRPVAVGAQDDHFFCGIFQSHGATGSMNLEFARQQMVEQQARAWDVLDSSVLDVLKTVPREQFVPAGFEALAFADTRIPLGFGETMLTPTIEGRVLQALKPARTERVLEVGTGSGFLAACLARLSESVVSVDIHEEFLASAAMNLEDAGIDNVELLLMDAMRELPEGLFDAVAVTGSVEAWEPRFGSLLNPGGRLFLVVGKAPVMDARRVQRGDDGELRVEHLFETRLRPLVHGVGPPQFLF